MTHTLSNKLFQSIKALIAPLFMVITMLTVATTQAAETQVKGEHNGQVMTVNGQSKVWEASSLQWISLDSFWQNWADSRGGITWGRSKDYPVYEQVKEQDTFLIELENGACMMEFWHSRWRRANDVRRWDDAFNTYSACNKVFD
ncbi:hypothetical protein FM038_021060 [Shewanella eurypsychrophilus]|uniref:Uncharacterized protein n=1 Tax=Shewanella eurypsychrophilus TaxID=2593656 RepID=A0ABX8S2Z0_9GAMM|nr:MULTISPECIES: hypothetical protein [Shewanella]QXP44918.1 hypothetical protein FM038_021060 [Shewanella eurypsychrophilus]